MVQYMLVYYDKGNHKNMYVIEHLEGVTNEAEAIAYGRKNAQYHYSGTPENLEIQVIKVLTTISRSD